MRADLDHHQDIIKDSLNQDIEFSGRLNRALGEGGKFALLLSMMHEDVLSRPRFLEQDDNAERAVLTHHYRNAPLDAQTTDWDNADKHSRLLRTSTLDSQLFIALNPQPLSIFNDAKRVPPEVVANCDYFTQQKMQNAPALSSVPVDETALYDVLQSIVS